MKKVLFLLLFSSLCFAQTPLLYYTTLTSGIDSDDTTLTFTSTDTTLAGSNTGYHAIIWDTYYISPSDAYKASRAEVILVNSRTANTFDVERGQLGSTARSFNTSGRRYRISMGLLGEVLSSLGEYGVTDSNRVVVTDRNQTIAGEKTFSSEALFSDTIRSRFILPNITETYQLGNDSYRWLDVYSKYLTATSGMYMGATQWMDNNRVIQNASWTGTSIDTAYTNAASKINAGTGISVTKNAKDYTIANTVPAVHTATVTATGVSLTANAIRWITGFNTVYTTSGEQKMYVGRACTLKNLVVSAYGNNNSTAIVTVFKSIASATPSDSSGITTGVITLTSNAMNYGADTVNTFALPAGGWFEFKVISGGNATNIHARIDIEY
jgi:hypothetical protein